MEAWLSLPGTTEPIDGPHLLLQSRPAECAAAISDFLLQVDARQNGRSLIFPA